MSNEAFKSQDLLKQLLKDFGLTEYLRVISLTIIIFSRNFMKLDVMITIFTNLAFLAMMKLITF